MFTYTCNIVLSTKFFGFVLPLTSAFIFVWPNYPQMVKHANCSIFKLYISAAQCWAAIIWSWSEIFILFQMKNLIQPTWRSCFISSSAWGRMLSARVSRNSVTRSGVAPIVPRSARCAYVGKPASCAMLKRARSSASSRAICWWSG